MASIQSHILAFRLRRQKFLSDEKIDPQGLRLRIEQAASKAKPHRQVRVVASIDLAREHNSEHTF